MIICTDDFHTFSFDFHDHCDAPPFDIIAGIALLAGCTFRFHSYEKARRNRKQVISLRLHSRSLYRMNFLPARIGNTVFRCKTSSLFHHAADTKINCRFMVWGLNF